MSRSSSAGADCLLDAVVYLNHRHVFANAMSGNVVFLGIAAVQRDWWQVLRHTVPLRTSNPKHLRKPPHPRNPPVIASRATPS